MNQETALKKGYERTGHYSFDRAEMEVRITPIKERGYKALIVFVPSSPYSRGHRSGGWAIVAEPRLRLDDTAIRMRELNASHEARCNSIRERHAAALAKELAEEEAHLAERNAWLAQNGR